MPFKLRVDAFPSLVVPGGSIVVSAAIEVAPGAKAPQVTIKPTNLPKGVTISPSQLTTDSVGTFRVTLPPNTNLGSTGFFFEGVAGALKSRSTGPATVDVVAAPPISVVQNLELMLNQAETFGLLLSSPFVGGLGDMKYETATVIPGATITFGARRSDGFVLMTVATTQQTPPATYPVDVVASDAFVPGSTTLTAQVVVKSNGVNDGFTLDAKLNGVSFDNVPVYGLSGATKPAQVVPGVTATVTVKVGGVNGQPTPPVRLEFASTADYQVTPETITTDNSATFSVKFLRASDSAIYIRLKGISGGKQQPANYPVLVSNKPIISYGNGCPLETNPSASSVTILVKVHKVTGMGPVTINVGRGGTSALMDWAITKRYPDGSADVTFTYVRQFLPSGGYELFDLVASAGNGSEFSTSRRVRILHNPELTACTT